MVLHCILSNMFPITFSIIQIQSDVTRLFRTQTTLSFPSVSEMRFIPSSNTVMSPT